MMTLNEAARALCARVVGPDVLFTGVSTDTRTLKAGDLFVALRGERFDGHRFLAVAADAGAAAAMVEPVAAHAPSSLPLLVVPATRLALGRLAAHWRARHRLPLVALTGSSGKTTVKEMLAAVLREATVQRSGAAGEQAVLATRGNLNNDIGVPLMLLELGDSHRYAVIEMGMNHAGEIRYLTQLALPDVALVNNAGRAHIEFLGSEEAIARAKGEIFEGLSGSGIAIINADDRFAPLWRELAVGRRRIEFGLESSAAVSATYRLSEATSEIVLTTPAGSASATLYAPGVHNVRNALAAAAAAVALDIPASTIALGLHRYAGVKGRLQLKRGLRGVQVIDDTYNANPESVRAALAVLAQHHGPRIFVFGDMGELGENAHQLHREVGLAAREARVDRMLALGTHAARAVEAFGALARHHTDAAELIAELTGSLEEGATVLVKGSRFMRMERIVEALTGEAGGGRREEEKP
jgi:UDP-N-acetylmuramoyl-tripeptide--D-alanyl-D-alanine ligase